MSAAIDTQPRARLDTSQRDVWPPRSAAQPCGRVWLAAYTHPQAERWANTQLTRRGFQTYLPLVWIHRRDRVVRSMRHHIQIPAFPRYLFVATDGPWTPIRYAPGVADLVWNEPGKPGTVANAAISALQAAEDVRATLPLPGRKWAPGTPCVVGNGMFDDVPAVVIQVGTEMATVAMMWFGHLREVAVQLDCLIARDE